MRSDVRKIVLSALMAALTCVATMIIKIPSPMKGYLNLGDCVVLTAGWMLPPCWGFLAAGLGSAIYDMMNPLYISEAWITFLTKAAYGLASGLVICCSKKPWTYVRATVATVAGAVVYAALYLAKTCFYSGMLLKGLPLEAAALTVVTKLPATVFNAVIAIVFAPVLAVSIRKALERNRLSLE